ncbi:hypothetical protein PMAL9190_00221 [Photobacterium malacitanum]|uniref:CBM-cenC domain-containing protein n=1 Tax=Photobacterium malacitanum TaxID=2204294 RepID=A0A1Y6M5H5_9GAMM|nr:hypothetical protein [Photobacterium malacitanum]SMY31832.1 hypothetical protein PMAL9190_00221 [Photobacterium malacitanum]
MSNNLILNGCFTNGFSSWGGDDFSILTDPVEGNYAHHNDISGLLFQILECGNTIKKNEHYQLTIKARSEKVNKMEPVLLINAGNNEFNIPCDNPDSHQLNSNWQELKFNFSIEEIEPKITGASIILKNFSDITNISLIKL